MTNSIFDSNRLSAVPSPLWWFQSERQEWIDIMCKNRYSNIFKYSFFFWRENSVIFGGNFDSPATHVHTNISSMERPSHLIRLTEPVGKHTEAGLNYWVQAQMTTNNLTVQPSDTPVHCDSLSYLNYSRRTPKLTVLTEEGRNYG